jgi:hypothetical protein
MVGVNAVVDTAAAVGRSVLLSAGDASVTSRLCGASGMDLVRVAVEALKSSVPGAGAARTLAVRERVGELEPKRRLDAERWTVSVSLALATENDGVALLGCSVPLSLGVSAVIDTAPVAGLSVT